MTSAADLVLRAGEHVVHFYEDEPALAAVAAGYLGAAVADGGKLVWAEIGRVVDGRR
jgi:hypothetical protein